VSAAAAPNPSHCCWLAACPSLLLLLLLAPLLLALGNWTAACPPLLRMLLLLAPPLLALGNWAAAAAAGTAAVAPTPIHCCWLAACRALLLLPLLLALAAAGAAAGAVVARAAPPFVGTKMNPYNSLNVSERRIMELDSRKHRITLPTILVKDLPVIELVSYGLGFKV